MVIKSGPRRWIAPDVPLACPGMRIGLFGGSFNPAHAGHVHVSRLARARLALDVVWWLVSPQNPLKPERGMAALRERVASAQAESHGIGFIRVTAFEAAIGTRFTNDTVGYLSRRFPGTHFVWVMGADNLAGFHAWDAWRDLAATLPLAVIDRPGAGLAAIASPAARALAGHRMDERSARCLATARPPAWSLLHGPLSDLSSTAIRGDSVTKR